jgi:2-phospho-L-lactate guanylyltransferase (CobY/MobA/RfbA family)
VSLWAIVPVKPFRQAKSRLASVLGDEERLVLSREMLRTVLAALTGVSRVERTLVVSRGGPLSLGRRSALALSAVALHRVFASGLPARDRRST